MKKLLACLFLVLCSTPAFAWNDKGHMVTARLAWRQLTDAQRARVVAILKKHPHYEEFLAANRAEGFSEEEWAFMRAATWADWVRSHHQNEFNHGPWHYINYPFVPPGSTVDAARHEPAANEENIVNQLAASVEKIRSGTDEEKAVHLCWLFHLTGDIHQPLHCTAQFSERFPQGDRGGNMVMIRIQSGPLNLHSFWDGLLGRGLDAASINKDVAEIEKVVEDRGPEIRKELEAHQTFESWGREGLELARSAAYLNGELKMAVSGGKPEDVPQVQAEYPSNAGRLARVQIGKAGIRLADQLKKLFP